MKNFVCGFVYGVKSMWVGFVVLCKECPVIATIWMAATVAMLGGIGYYWHTRGFIYAICWYTVVGVIVNVGMVVGAITVKVFQRAIANWIYRTMTEIVK